MVDDTDDDNTPQLSLGDFVDSNYPERKRRILEKGLRCLWNIHQQRDWSYWSGTINAARIIAEEVCSRHKLDLGPDLDTGKGSVFQTRFLPRWEKYEDLARARSNHPPISSGERSFMLFLIKNPEALRWRENQLPQRQRKMLHPSSVVAGYRAALREQEAEKTLTPKDRLISELDQRHESDAKTIRELKRRLDDHEWDHRDEVTQLIATLTVKLRNHKVDDQVFAIEQMLANLGWTGSTLDALNRIVKKRK